jgi:hypothetical protein
MLGQRVEKEENKTNWESSCQKAVGGICFTKERRAANSTDWFKVEQFPTLA